MIGLTKRQRAGLCQSPTCPYLTVPAIPDRSFCEHCCQRLKERAAELRRTAS